MPQPILTICIVHYRKLPQLKKTVSALLRNTSVPFNLKVLNNGYEGDGIRKYLETLKQKNKKTVKVIFHPKNIGCSPGRNIVVRNIKTDFIMMLDDDMYVNKGWDVPVWKAFRSNPLVGAVGFSIYRTNGQFWWTGGRNLEIVGRTIKIKSIKLNPTSTSKRFLEVDDVAAGAMVYKRKELAPIIAWDPGYFVGFEDLEKGVYLKRNKYKCLVSIQSKFVHEKVSENSSAALYNAERRNYHAYRKSYLLFIKKNQLKLPLDRHLFYKYVCLLPNNLIQKIAYLWLKVKK